MALFREELLGLQKDLSILKEREAKYGGNPPLELIHQIEDYEAAIALTQQVLKGELSEASWEEALRPLLITIRDRFQNNEELSGVTIGPVEGGVHGSIIAGRDIIQNITYLVGDEPPKKPDIPLQSFEPETVFIPAGPFVMGEDDAGTWVRHDVILPAYKIAKYPVSNEQYYEFVKQTGASVSPKAGWELAKVGQQPPTKKLNHPVVGVSWDEAGAYCHWLTEQTDRRYRLPSEAEWEKAARGAEDARLYPWGDDFDPDRCNHTAGDTTPIDQFSPQSPYGCHDLAGNVWEWTRTNWGRDQAAPDYTYPYPPPDQPDGRDTAPPEKSVYREYRICRGGSFKDQVERLRCSTRARFAADSRHARRGFRVVQEL